MRSTPELVAACQELARRQGLSISWFSARDCRSDQAVLESLEAALEPSTRLVVLSHLLWNSGLTMPIEAVADRLKQHPRQPWLLVDAAQSMGSLSWAVFPMRPTSMPSPATSGAAAQRGLAVWRSLSGCSSKANPP